VEFEDAVEVVGQAVDIAGVVVMICGALAATGLFARWLVRREDDFPVAYRRYRQSLGRAILLGLEFLVAGDIIRTVAVSPSFSSVGVLAAIVAVRTFLSFSLEVELEGRWPWQRPPSAGLRQPDTRSAG